MSKSQHPLDNKLLLGRYRVMRLLGEGGMGTVHLARVEGAEGFTRPVVVKRMKRDIRATEEGNRLFIREAKILSKLRHPNIVGISDFGVEDNAHIMVLEYVHGYNLGPWLDYRHHLDEPLPVEICVYIVRRILDALHYAHHFDTQEGRETVIVHRDISPDNVLLSNKGYVHLLDFGIASMRGPQGDGSTKNGAFRGKLCYAAPETVNGEPATPHSDQYSAAVLLLELLTGNTPFAADSIAQTFAKMVNEIPEPPSAFRKDIPAGLDDVLLRALDKDPKRRFESALAFSRELRRFQDQDDEDTAQKLRDLVSEDFAKLPATLGIEGLEEREAALEKILSVLPGPPGTPVDLISLPPHEMPTLLEADLSASGGRETPAAVATSAPAQKQLHGLLFALLVVGGLIAVGLGAAVALLSRQGNEQQVVVVGGERASGQGTQPTDEVGQASSAAHGSDTRGAFASSSATGNTSRPSATATPTDTLDEPSALPETSSAQASSDAARSPRGSQSRDQRLSRAVQTQSGAFQACFSQHLGNPDDPPKAVLHFSVARPGGAAQVQVEPPSLAATPLGACLKGAASRVQFPKLEEPVTFRLPVSARISRSD